MSMELENGERTEEEGVMMPRLLPATDQDKPHEDQKQERERSTIAFPYADLDSAISVARAIYENGGGQCELAQLAAWMGHETVNSGAFTLKVSAARLFGLIDGERSQIRLTGLGRDTLDPNLERQSRATAFLTVPLYERLHQEFKGVLLPPDNGLEQTMRNLGVATKQADRARQTFQRSASQAGFFQAGKNRLVMPSIAAVERTSNAGDTQGGSVQAGGRRDTFSDGSGNTRGDGSSGGSGGTGSQLQIHPAIQGFLQTLPAPNSPWSEEEQQLWLSALGLILKVVYKQ